MKLGSVENISRIKLAHVRKVSIQAIKESENRYLILDAQWTKFVLWHIDRLFLHFS
jgi:hypothetical protein